MARPKYLDARSASLRAMAPGLVGFQGLAFLRGGMITKCFIVSRPVRGLVLRRGPTAHTFQLSRWIHAVNPSPDLRNKASAVPNSSAPPLLSLQTLYNHYVFDPGVLLDWITSFEFGRTVETAIPMAWRRLTMPCRSVLRVASRPLRGAHGVRR